MTQSSNPSPELVFTIDSIEKSKTEITFKLSTRDENTIRELERTYHHRLTTDGIASGLQEHAPGVLGSDQESRA